jgi:hypothetical protein
MSLRARAKPGPDHIPLRGARSAAASMQVGAG